MPRNFVCSVEPTNLHNVHGLPQLMQSEFNSISCLFFLLEISACLQTQKSGHKKKVSLMMAMAKVCAVFFSSTPQTLCLPHKWRSQVFSELLRCIRDLNSRQFSCTSLDGLQSRTRYQLSHRSHGNYALNKNKKNSSFLVVASLFCFFSIFWRHQRKKSKPFT